MGRWHQAVPSLIARTFDAPGQAVLRERVLRIAPGAAWRGAADPFALPGSGSGRVALVGDAWHPEACNLAQGASVAIEDAEALAESLAEAARGEAPWEETHVRK